MCGCKVARFTGHGRPTGCGKSSMPKGYPSSAAAAMIASRSDTTRAIQPTIG
jgi:hypothetical protein